MNRVLPVSYVAGLRKLYYLIGLLILILCVAQPSAAQTVRTGKSYVNITRPNGGTFLPGDIIEVRATIAVTGGSSTTRLNYVRYNDTINLAKFDYIPGTLRMLSNEGRTQYQYQDGPNTADNDSAHIDLATGRLRFNIGRNSGGANVLTQGTGITNAGQLWGGSYFPPSFFGNTCIRMYAYRIQIKSTPADVAVDSTILLSAGNFRYRVGSSSTDQISNFRPYYLYISPDLGLCSNAIGSNAILGENGGTFGSGATQNRAGGTTFVPAPYTFINFAASAPNDNYYGLANRTSANGSTDNNIAYPNSARVHSVWDIIGDHTNASDPIAGNPATNNGYAVIINASYETNRAFSQDITGLCEDTYYEFSAWFRNICRRCGCDSTGKGASQTGYTPSPGNDSAGVKPNLTFQVDGIDLYTTGEIAYSGGWVKKGFIFRTRPGQNFANVTIRNNAPGGGGNDWAIDDIAVSTCLPNMSYAPSVTPNVCTGNSLVLEDTVRSYFDNYTYFKWQRSTDNGGSWTDVTGEIGPISPVWNGSAYEYISQYTLPPGATNVADSGDLYRLITGTSGGNLSVSNCMYTDNTNIVTVSVLDCGPVLKTTLLHFSARSSSQGSVLSWAVGDEEEGMIYEIERSNNGTDFQRIASVAYLPGGGTPKFYSYTDASNQTGFYRIRLLARSQASTFSSILKLDSDRLRFDLGQVLNPFQQQLQFNLQLAQAGRVQWKLMDISGNVWAQQTLDLSAGVHQLVRQIPPSLPASHYILVAEMNGQRVYRKLVKAK